MSLRKNFGRLARGETQIDFAGRAWRWALISGAILLVSILGLAVRKLNLGLEFEGGTSFSVPLADRSVSVTDLRDAIEPLGLSGASVQISTDRLTNQRDALVRSERIESQEERSKVRAALTKVAGQTDPNAVTFTDVGATWGREISNKMLRALIVFLILVVTYISIRFEPKMAVAALAAVFHDLIATAGIYALVGFEVTPATVIALLTLLGYSLYDTVVVFDRVRENEAAMPSRSPGGYAEMVNRSVNQVLIRSVNTSLTSLLPVGGLLFVGAFLLGAGTLKDLALALFLGTAVSTYSSVYVAAPILARWKEREPKYRQARERITGRAPRPAAAAAGAGRGAEGGAEEERRPVATQRRQGPKPRSQRRKKRRRR